MVSVQTIATIVVKTFKIVSCPILNQRLPYILNANKTHLLRTIKKNT